MRFRAVVGNDEKIQRTFYVGSTATDVTGALAVTVTREDGTVLTGANATDEAGTGVYSFTLDDVTHTSRLDVLTLTWTGLFGGLTRKWVDQVDVVGNRMFELAELKNLPTALNPVPTDETLEAARRQVEDAIEEATGRAWIRRYARDRFDGTGKVKTFLTKTPARALIAVKFDGSTQDTAGWTLQANTGQLRTDGDAIPTANAGQNIDVLYEHGADNPPDDLRLAGLRWARHLIAGPASELPDRAMQVSYDWGSYRLTMASVEYPSGLPDVDAVIGRYCYSGPLVG